MVGGTGYTVSGAALCRPDRDKSSAQLAIVTEVKRGMRVCREVFLVPALAALIRPYRGCGIIEEATMNAVNLAPYRDRRTWLIDVREIKGWQLKVYGICAHGCQLHTDVVDAAVWHVSQNVDWGDAETGYGFVTFHSGEEAVWLMVDLWANDILRHSLFRAPLSQPDQFQPGPVDGTIACVWELAVLFHEREAWVKHVLSSTDIADFQAYMRDVLNIPGG